MKTKRLWHKDIFAKIPSRKWVNYDTEWVPVIEPYKLLNLCYMKKVEFMKLNLQQENILSKEEKKILLGGYGTSCYVNGSFGGEIAVGNCDKATVEYYCGSGGQGSGCYCKCKVNN